MNPAFNEARLNLAALSLNNRDYKTAEENFHAVLEAQPKNYEAALGLGVALRGAKKIDEAEAQYNEALKLDASNPSSYFNLGLLYQEYKDGQKPTLQKAQSYYRQFLSHASSTTGDNLQREAQKRIKDIDEIYVALEEAAKMQAESEAMQRKAEAQQKEMEEKMKQQEAQEAKEAAAAKEKGAAPANGEAPKEGAAAKDPAAKPEGGAAPAATPVDDAGGKPAGGKRKRGKK
jgi:tetratricopeptide (TPR) repeat protein